MSPEAVEFFMHRFLALAPVVAGYLAGWLMPTRLAGRFIAVQVAAGFLTAAASWLTLGQDASPAYHPLYYFNVLGVSAVVTSRLKFSTPPTTPELPPAPQGQHVTAE